MIVLLFGIYWLIDAISLVKSTRDDSKPLIDRYLDSDHAKLGAAILGAFLWATLATTAAYLKGAA